MRDELKIFKKYLKQKGLKQTTQREVVLKLFLESPKHLSVDELSRRVRESDPGIGHSTVYRTLKLLAGCGLALESQFLYGRTCFEPAWGVEPHHHLICTRCGTISEFRDPLIGAVRDKICKGLDFKPEADRMEVYGVCSDCQGPRELREED